MLVKEGKISGWLIEDMQKMMLDYSHDVATLNVAVARGELPYMAKFRRVFPDFFEDEFWLRTASN